MGSLEKIKTKLLRKTFIQGIGEEYMIVLTQFEELCKGVTIYKVYLELEDDGTYIDILESYSTCNRVKSDSYFFKVEGRYSEERIVRRIF